MALARSRLQEFILQVCPPLLGIPKPQLYEHLTAGGPGQKFADIDDILAQFVQDASTRFLICARRKDTLMLKVHPDSALADALAVALIKRPRVAELDELDSAETSWTVWMAQKLQVVTLHFGDGQSVLETLQNILQNSMLPMLATQPTEELGNVRRKLQELVGAVQQAQQASSIKMVELVCDPVIIQAVKNGTKLTDLSEEFLNKLQRQATQWLNNIHEVVMQEASLQHTASEEINYWLNLEGPVKNVQDQLSTAEVAFQLEVLQSANRMPFFLKETGLENRLQQLKSINSVMRDLPHDKLLSATKLSEVRQSVLAILTHLRRMKQAPAYSPGRVMGLLGLVSKDLCTQMTLILSKLSLFEMTFLELSHLYSSCQQIATVWEEEVRKLRDTLRQAGAARGPPVPPLEHAKLISRLDEIVRLRKEHKDFSMVLAQAMIADGGEHSQNCIELNQSLQQLQTPFVLEIHPPGRDEWEMSVRKYVEKLSKFETRITQEIRERLGAAHDSNEMFRVVTEYNPLFSRPKIHTAVKEHQGDLIRQVKSDFKGLQHKLRSAHDNAESSFAACARGFPPIVEKVVWMRQIENKIQLASTRMENVWGPQWQELSEGQQMKNEVQSFLKVCNYKELYMRWAEETKQWRSFDLGSRPILIIKKTGPRRHELAVNCDPAYINIWKIARSFASLGFRTTFVIKTVADEARVYYPAYQMIDEALRACKSLADRLATDPRYQNIGPLLAMEQQTMQDIIVRGIHNSWTSDASQLAFDMSTCIDQLEAKLTQLSETAQQMTRLMIALKDLAVAADAKSYQNIVASLQENVIKLLDAGFANLEQFVSSLDREVENYLTEHCHKIVTQWVKEFTTWPHSGTSLVKDKSVCQIDFVDKSVITSPSLDELRQVWVQSFHRAVAKLSDLPHLGLHPGSQGSYQNLLTRIEKELVAKAYQAVDELASTVSSEIDIWRKLATIWDVDISYCAELMGDDLNAWTATIDLLRAKKLEASRFPDRRQVGPVTIDCSLVQGRVDQKYELRIKEVVQMFGEKINDFVVTFFRKLAVSRTALEKQGDLGSARFTHLDPNKLTGQDENTRLVVNEISNYIQLLKDAEKVRSDWKSQVEQIENAEKLLQSSRYLFPPGWIYSDQVSGEWLAFNKLLDQQTNFFERHRSQLQLVTRVIDRKLTDAIERVHEQWRRQKPVGGETSPTEALKTLHETEEQLRALNAQGELLDIAKAALGLPVESSRTIFGGADPRVVEEELANLMTVWSKLATLHESVDKIKSTPWVMVVPKTVRESIEALVAEIKQIPVRYRQYEAFDKAQTSLQTYLTLQSLITQMKSETLKDRHWKRILEILAIRKPYNELTLGDVYDANPKANEEAIKDALTWAQGESGLSEFLIAVKDVWSAIEFTFVSGKPKAKLISNGDELFTILDEHLNLLQSMRLSPYFESFESEATAWDEKLTKLRSILDVWLDVQRKWVYLEGVFSGSLDIQALLPAEYSRFKAIDAEFTAIMRKVATRPKVIDVVNQEGVLKTLTRLTDMLIKVQKALSDYLEQQRNSCPRFYFVGDEDLLEMIGNARVPTTVQRHLNKMFAGIHTLDIDPENPCRILGMISKEQEEVKFQNAIEITPNTSLMNWLIALEANMKHSLAVSLAEAIKAYPKKALSRDNTQPFFDWMNKYPTQVVLLCVQTSWTRSVEKALHDGIQAIKSLKQVALECRTFLGILAEHVMTSSDRISRTKTIQLITEVVHQRDVCEYLIAVKACQPNDFGWLQHVRYYYNESESDEQARLSVRVANATFRYGFEYLGVADRLVQTPLTDKCCLTMAQALHFRLGGNPFGPAGTGKTETVKFLGTCLGRLVLVFNCDEAFDFQAMGRIFVGLCEVGAWGCFDEFNRLEERMLSAVSEQILTIQTGLREKRKEVDLLCQSVRLSPDVGIFVTMNPGYAGRSNLPDNLKQLFREFAMIEPDKDLITEVMLYSQGLETADKLAAKVVSLFDLCSRQLSQQPHYDFGLRALKSVLTSAGHLKRKLKSDVEKIEEQERMIVIRSICDSMIPKLIQKDVPRLQSILTSVFPGATTLPIDEAMLDSEITTLCMKKHLVPESAWKQKILQLYQIQNLNHGVMLVGPTGAGKTSAWTILMEALERLDGCKGVSYVIDPKALSKEQLFGWLDPTTLEWTDGVFTATLRKILNSSGKQRTRHWIIFDGDVDPEWAENLNSALDDNKLVTLPNGERFQIPANVRLMFETDTLKSATPATVSRCGMVWMSDAELSLSAVFTHSLSVLKGGIGPEAIDVNVEFKRLMSSNPSHYGRTETLDKSIDAVSTRVAPMRVSFGREALVSEEARHLRFLCVNRIEGHFARNNVVEKCLEAAEAESHVMDFTRIRVIEALFAALEQVVANLIDHNEDASHCSEEAVVTYIGRSLVISILWTFGGSMCLAARTNFARKVAKLFQTHTNIGLPSDIGASSNWTLLDYQVVLGTGEWRKWRNSVPAVELEPRQLDEPTLVIETSDTRSHQEIITSFLKERRPFILCGPPGSGKTMTFLSTLRSLESEFTICSLNFSSGTTPGMLLKSFNHYCEYVKTASGMVLRPTTPGKWLVLFCDEINLPSPDQYGTQKVISFLRQMVSTGGFWKMTSAGIWERIKLERIQFAGACNPPTDAGRHDMSDRFLRCAPVLFVDFPGEDSLRKIYGTFNRAILNKRAPRHLSDPLTEAMVEFFQESQKQFTVDHQPHYIYSPRELSRWKVAIHEALNKRVGETSAIELIRLAIHEAQRIFGDRLVCAEHRVWTESELQAIFLKHFASVTPTDLQGPILFSPLLTGSYEEASIPKLRSAIQSKLSVFREEEVSVDLVLFDECLQHILRIDRVLRQPLGHLLLVGVSGAGKTILSKFVAWLNGLSVFQIKAGRDYDTNAFENDLRAVMRRAGVREEKIVFIFDESNVLGPAFLERMNALLASGEVPGLFEHDEYLQLIAECRSAFGADLDESELFSKFTRQVQRNLHIVFTMNPANPDFYNRQATSPALFNRCVIDWFGDWSREALLHVAREFTAGFDVPNAAFSTDLEKEGDRRELLTQAIVGCHDAVAEINIWLGRQGRKRNFVAPRDFIDFIRHLLGFVTEKRSEITETSRHLTVGLRKLAETEAQVADLQASLAAKEAELADKQQLSSEKMQAMIEQKAEAEGQKKHAEILAQELDVQESRITDQKTEVERQLSEVQPLLMEAKESVSSIPKRALEELRALSSPPHMVRVVCEAVVVLLSNSGEKAPSWEEVRKALRGDFINRILSFDATKPDAVSQITVSHLKKRYLDSAEWDYSRIDKASKAAGPLSKWVSSSCSYAEIVLKVDPLRQQISSLQSALKLNQTRLQQTNELIGQLETKLMQLQSEYAQLIADEQQIKREMDSVKKKVETSKQMLNNLAAEQERWARSCETSQERLRTEIGDNVLAAAFTTYIGFFEQIERERILGEWQEILTLNHIKYYRNLSLTEYSSKSAERYQWLAAGLPPDDLSMENTVILTKFIRYPLIIDPSGQATEFIMNMFADKKIAKVSYSDANFVKQLESALRFGTALLVQDVEHMDTVLNNVLNQETHKSGGRVLITIGDNEVDFSPTFMLFLTTRDPTVQFTPDLCSRVTLINYTTTPASLRNQCLNMVLRSERPDVERKRRDVLKLQGEFRVKVRELEDALLNSLANVTGNILDDDRVIRTLEDLKKQAAEVNRESQRADEIMEEVDKTTAMYIPIADAAARLYTTLEHLSGVYFLYHYDLNFFETIFKETLNDKAALEHVLHTDYHARADVLLSKFFKSFYDRCTLSQLHKDKLVLGLQFARIRFESLTQTSLQSPELDLLLQSKFGATLGDENVDATSLETAIADLLDGRLNIGQVRALQALSTLEAFIDLLPSLQSHEEFWIRWLEGDRPEETTEFPRGICSVASDERFLQSAAFQSLAPNMQSMIRVMLERVRKALLIKALRSDRLTAALEQVVSAVMGEDFLTVPTLTNDLLLRLLRNSIGPTTPVVFVSAPGFDPSNRVVSVAHAASKTVASIAMGSEEGYRAAEQSIQLASKTGSWVLLKNVHLATKGWLSTLERTLFKSKHHDGFRLFLTMEFKDKIPTNLLRLSYKFVFEPPVGMRASLERLATNFLSSGRSEKEPVFLRFRLHFHVALLHAIVLERRRFAPVGWTKAYEFSDADVQCALEIVDEWLELVRSSDPEKIPWNALQTLLGDVIYGSRLDNPIDVRVLKSFVTRLFSPAMFKENQMLCPRSAKAPPFLAPPLARSRDDYIDWIKQLPMRDHPTWIGLAAHADRLLAADEATNLLSSWSHLNHKSAVELRLMLPPMSMFKSMQSFATMQKQESTASVRSVRSVQMAPGVITSQNSNKVSLLQNSLPGMLTSLTPKSNEGPEDPLFRFFDNEVRAYTQLRELISTDLTALENVLTGRDKFTNHTREIAAAITAGEVPHVWNEQPFGGPGTSLDEWILDFAKRGEQLGLIVAYYQGAFIKNSDSHAVVRQQVLRDLQELTHPINLSSLTVRCLWPGGLSHPEFFISATKQKVAQLHQWPIDDLQMSLEIGEAETDKTSFLLLGLYAFGAMWDSSSRSLKLCDAEVTRLPPTRLRWIRRVEKIGNIELPIFLTKQRQHRVAIAEFTLPAHEDLVVWYQRSVAFVLWYSL